MVCGPDKHVKCGEMNAELVVGRVAGSYSLGRGGLGCAVNKEVECAIGKMGLVGNELAGEK